jgi:hypothetical protein
MRPAVRFLLPALLLAPAVGCEWMEKMKSSTKDGLTHAGGPVKPATAPELVGYLNGQAAPLQSIRYTDVHVEVKSGKSPSFALNDSSLVCAKPRNFLLVGGRHIASNLVNIGSNDREFWMYTKYPETTFLYCSHAEFPQAGRQLPVPFDPDWALQALGMTTYDPGLAYKVDTDVKNREHRLSWDTTTPQGVQVRREIVFDAFDTAGREPQVKRHLILTPANKLIASADVKEVATVPIGRDPQTGKPTYAQVPTRVVLSWPQQDFRMDLNLRKPTVNEALPESEKQRLFTRPAIEGTNPVNLADGRFTPSSFRGAAPGDLPPRRR